MHRVVDADHSAPEPADMADAIASEINHEPNRRRRQVLGALLARLEHTGRR